MRALSRRLLFLTGTRADFGKLKPLLVALRDQTPHEVFLFTTGMHMLKRYGSTWDEVQKAEVGSVYMFVNQNDSDAMDSVLAKTVSGLSDFVREIQPDLIVVHGDRIEALAGALVGTLNRILVAHIEGGEVSGTIDEIMRHTITKSSHLHFVSNEDARLRLLQLGERQESIFPIGSPEVDVFRSQLLPTREEMTDYYGVPFQEYGIVLFHPVTTELGDIPRQAKNLVDYVLNSGLNWIVIYPNNDEGTTHIQREYERLRRSENVRLLPSMRFEYYVSALKTADLILGNSSSGVREAAYFGVPAVNLGSRQSNRAATSNVIHSTLEVDAIAKAVYVALRLPREPVAHFGSGGSGEAFVDILSREETWRTPIQKLFVDLARSRSQL